MVHLQREWTSPHRTNVIFKASESTLRQAACFQAENETLRLGEEAEPEREEALIPNALPCGLDFFYSKGIYHPGLHSALAISCRRHICFSKANRFGTKVLYIF